LWEVTDLPDFDPGLFWGACDAATGFSYRTDKIVAFDLVSGRRLWDASALPPFQEIRGYVSLRGPGVLLLFLRTPASDRSLVALRLSTGERVWQRDDLFAHSPAFAGRGGVSDISEYQAFIADTDSTLLLYASPDGPMRLDLRTGATLWKGDALAGPRVPSLRDYGAMRVVDSGLVIPREKGLVALDTRDGHVLWAADTLLPAHASRLAGVPSGLLVRAGRAHMIVLDAATGQPRWERPFTAPTDGAAYEIVGDRYFVVTRDRLVVVDLASGDTTGLANLAFRDGEHAQEMFALDDGLLIASRQNLFHVGFEGAVRYHQFYKAPGASFFEVLGGVSPGAQFGMAAFRAEYAYFVTSAPDSAGRTGNSLVRVVVTDGSEAGRIWFREKAPWYRPDTARDQLLV
jgi:outer membrane protein assembly factor BamB